MSIAPIFAAPAAPAAPAASASRRFLLLSYHFPPGQATGALRWQKLVGHAAERAWRFDVVTVGPGRSEATDRVRLDELPAGTRVFGVARPGTRSSKLRPLLRAAFRRRAATPLAPPASPPNAAPVVETGIVFREETRWRLTDPRDTLRALHAADFFRQEWRWAREASRLARRLLAEGGYDGVISCGPPHMIHLAASRLAARAGLPHVMDFRDPWSLVPGLYDNVASPVWYGLAHRFERASVRRAALVVTNTEAHREALAAAHPDRADRMIAVHNGCDNDVAPRAKEPGCFTIAYAGNVYIDRDPRPLFRAVAELVREEGLAPGQLAVHFVGDVASFGGQPLGVLAEAEGIGRFLTLHGRRPRHEALELLSGADMLVSLPQGVDLAIPSKIFEYVQYEAWVLALARRGSATELLLRGSGADVVDPMDVAGLAAVLRQRYRQYAAGELPHPLNADGRFDREHQAERLFTALEARLAPRTAPVAHPATPASEAVSVREYFDNNVSEWDRDRYQNPIYTGRGAVALRWLGRSAAPRRVLDVGCGAGHQSLAAVRQGHRVVSMDFAFEMARATRDRLRREAPEHPPLVVVADAMHPPFRDGSFDSVVALGLVGFLPDRTTLLRGMRALVRPGSELICDVGVPEERVLFRSLDRLLTGVVSRVRAALSPARARGAHGTAEPPSFYARAFHKHTPEELEGLLRAAGFVPEAAGGAGFGEVRILGHPVLPWRLEVWLTRKLNALSLTAAGRPLARRALIYVTRSTAVGAVPATGGAGALLFVANFPSDTGYAWSTITDVFERIGRRHARLDGRSLIAFPKLCSPLPEGVLTPVEADYAATRTPRGLLRFLRLLRRHQVRTLYLTDLPTWDLRYPLFRLAGVRTIVVHDRTSGARASRGPLVHAVKRSIHRLPGLAADRFVGVSDFVARRLRETNGTPEARTTRVYNGIDLTRYADPDRTALHRLLGLAEDASIVYCSGRAQPYKGIQVLIEAAARLAKRGRDVHFVYCGDGPGLGALRAAAAASALASFHFLGKRGDVSALLGSATVAVVPSLWEEAFGLTVVEAMAAGVPVVASRVGGIPELIEEGRTGMLVSPGDADELARALDQLLADPAARARMAAAGIAASRAFDIERTADNLYRVVSTPRRAETAMAVELSHAD